MKAALNEAEARAIAVLRDRVASYPLNSEDLRIGYNDARTALCIIDETLLRMSRLEASLKVAVAERDEARTGAFMLQAVEDKARLARTVLEWQAQCRALTAVVEQFREAANETIVMEKVADGTTVEGAVAFHEELSPHQALLLDAHLAAACAVSRSPGDALAAQIAWLLDRARILLEQTPADCACGYVSRQTAVECLVALLPSPRPGMEALDEESRRVLSQHHILQTLDGVPATIEAAGDRYGVTSVPHMRDVLATFSEHCSPETAPTLAGRLVHEELIKRRAPVASTANAARILREALEKMPCYVPATVDEPWAIAHACGMCVRCSALAAAAVTP